VPCLATVPLFKNPPSEKMIAPLSCIVLTLFAMANAQINSSTSSTQQSSPVPVTIKGSSSLSNSTDTPTTTSLTTVSCNQITCYPPPPCSGARKARQSGTGVDSIGCPTCYSYTCECLAKPCPRPPMCPNGGEQPTDMPKLDSDGCPNCPNLLPCGSELTRAGDGSHATLASIVAIIAFVSAAN
jgi:hypothetical protein